MGRIGECCLFRYGAAREVEGCTWLDLARADVTPISRFGLKPVPRPGLMLGYASVDEQAIWAGAQRLASALRDLGDNQCR